MPGQLKTKETRLKQSLVILKKFRDELFVSMDLIQPLKVAMDEYIETGNPWNGKIEMPEIGRIAYVNFPKYEHQPIEVDLKIIRKK